MASLLKENLALIAKRQVKTDAFSQVFISNTVGEAVVLESAYAKAQYFPLFISKNGNQTLFDTDHRRVNFSSKFQKLLESSSFLNDKNTKPQDIFYYIYAILFSNDYRKRYFDFLKTGYPKIPFTNDKKLFFELSKLGNQLANLHLLKSDSLNKKEVRLIGNDNSEVKTRKWKDNKVWINPKQYFAPVSKQVWEYYIAGYQMADRWLKERQKRSSSRLTREEIKNYCQMITAISETISIQKEIDQLYPEIEKTLS